jgi:sugar/nucleoside kinase (ribokinase family)
MKKTSSAKPLRSISIGGATFDLFVATQAGVVEHDGQHVLHLPLGAKIPAQSVHGRSGGGACNSATGLARLGLRSALCAVIGDDQWGHLVLDQLAKEGVDAGDVTVAEGDTTGFSMIFSAADGERVIVSGAGANTHLRPVTLDAEMLQAADVVYLNRLQPGSDALELSIADVLADAKARLTWNPGGSQVGEGMDDPENARLLARTDVLLLNKEEALAFSGGTDMEDALRRLAAACPAVVCITDGKQGVVATDGERRFACPILPAPVVDTTGAGDAFGKRRDMGSGKRP